MYNPYLNVKLNQNLDPCTYTNTNVYVKGLTWTNAVTLNIVVLRVSESDAATRRSRPITVNVPLLPTQGQKERRNIQLQHDTGVDTDLFTRFVFLPSPATIASLATSKAPTS